MHQRLLIISATLALSTAAFAQTSLFSNDGVYQIGYAANLNIGDSVLNISNDGLAGGFFGAGTTGNLCANVYTFDPTEEEISCCSCLVTPNGLNSLSVKSDLISNTLTPAVPNSVVIKLLSSQPIPDANGNFTKCDPTTAGVSSNTTLSFGLLAWGSTLEPAGSPNTYNAVTVPYATGQLSIAAHGGYLRLNDLLPPGVGIIIAGIIVGNPFFAPQPGSELAALTSTCNFLQANGTGFGVCRQCRTGALSGSKQ